jgi:hypothetical protein
MGYAKVTPTLEEIYDAEFVPRFNSEEDAMRFEDQYKHPEWQKKRLEIMKRHEFMCQSCDATEKQLFVHHKFYSKNTLLWQYPDESYETLCEDCHAKADALREEVKRAIGCLPLHMIEHIHGYAKGLEMSDFPMTVFRPLNDCDADGMAKAFSSILDYSDVWHPFNDDAEVNAIASEVQKMNGTDPKETIQMLRTNTFNGYILDAMQAIKRRSKKELD